MEPPPPLTDADTGPNGAARLVLLGPPGTGKTRRCVDSWILPVLRACRRPDEILSCSFSRAAAHELQVRVGREFPLSIRDQTRMCSTIHAEAFRRACDGVRALYLPGRGLALLRQHETSGEGPEELLDERFESEPGRRGDPLLRRFERPLVEDAIRVHDWARHSLQPLTAEGARKLVPMRSFAELRRVIHEYEALKDAEGAIDFTDMLIRALELAEAAPPARALLLLDEAQDCTKLMWRLFQRWAQSAQRVVCVGDPDQTVHRWAGADPEHFLALTEQGFVARRLTQSHRVPRSVHRFARGIVLRCRSRIDAPYEPVARDGCLRRLSRSAALERVRVAVESRQRVFVLARSHALLRTWAKSLEACRLPYIFQKGGRAPLNDASTLACVRALLDVRRSTQPKAHDLATLIGILPLPATGARFFSSAGRPKLRFEEAPSIEALLVEGVDLRPLVNAGSVSAAIHLARLPKAALGIAELARIHGRDLLNRPDLLVLTTLHQSKGQERSLVLLDARVPKSVRRALHRPGVLDDERRLLYVGATRAIDELVLVGQQMETLARFG
ncbi:MAG: ATP-dependent helicase [Planctomycetes bacterium]|nr:ATP-dependent helicase [Planctomycetota bacterium]